MNNKNSSKPGGAKWCFASLCGLAMLLLGAAARPPALKAGTLFTIVMLPDTQHHSRRYHDLFVAQTEWIRANRDKENIVFVTHVGDIVNDRKKNTNQWMVAQKAMSVLDGVVTWGVAIGNHDCDSTACRPDEATAFLERFGPQRFRGYSWFGGASANGLNIYQLFSAGGLDLPRTSSWSPWTYQPAVAKTNLPIEHDEKPTFFNSHCVFAPRHSGGDPLPFGGRLVRSRGGRKDHV